MRLLRIAAWTLATTVGLASCGSEPTGPTTDSCTAETSVIQATVTTGQSVVFDWAPACRVAMLLVEPPDSAVSTFDRWAVWTDEATWESPEQGNRISPPVTYGVTPAGIVNVNGPEVLVPGREYELIIWRILPVGSTSQCIQRFDNACLLTVHVFTR